MMEVKGIYSAVTKTEIVKSAGKWVEPECMCVK